MYDNIKNMQSKALDEKQSIQQKFVQLIDLLEETVAVQKEVLQAIKEENP